MKRLLSIVLMLALCAVMLGGALAEAPVEVLTLENADWVDGSNYLQIRGDNGYYIAGLDGAAITGEDYGRSMNYSNGLIIANKVGVEGLNAYGALNESGAEVIPFQYAEIKALNECWATAIALEPATAENYDYSVIFGDIDYAIISTVDIYNLASGTCVASLSRSEYSDSEAFGTYINIENRTDGVVTTYDADFNALGTVDYVWDEDLIPAQGLQTYYDNGQYGLKDAEGNVVMEPAFRTIYNFDGGYAEVSTGEKSGLIDEAGNVIVPAIYDKVNRGYNTPEGTSRHNNAGYFCVVQDGKLGYVIAGGTVSCEPKYSADALDNNGASAIYTDVEGKTHIIAGDGVESVIEGYEYMYPADNASGVFYRVRNADRQYGLIDFHGNAVLPCQYEGVEMSGDGRYALVEVERDTYVVYEISYPEPVAGEAAAAAASEAASETENAPEAENAAEAESGNAGIVALLDSAILLLNQDAAANNNAIVGLLNSAINEVGAETAAGAIINSVIQLVQTNASANAASAAMLLENAKTAL